MTKFTVFLLFVALICQTTLASLHDVEEFLRGVKNGTRGEKEILRIGPLALQYLGAFEGKNYFLEPTQVPQQSARAACLVNGMHLVEFSGLASFNFVRAAVGSTSTNFFWTDYINKESHDCFIAKQDSHSLPTAIPISANNGNGQLGLRASFGTQLVSVDSVSTNAYVCML